MSYNLKVVRVLGFDHDIVAEVNNAPGSCYVLKNPCWILLMPPDESDSSSKGDFKLAMHPMQPPYVKGECITVDKRHVLYTADPIDQVSDRYDQVFSPIIQPSSLVTPKLVVK